MFTLNCKGRLLVVDKPLVMGIINITPDSFYAGSRHQELEMIVEKAGEMIRDGAMILDVGGQSTRPGSEQLNAQDEIQRVVPAIEAISSRYSSVIISVDTFYAEVARHAVKAGASIVNDISAGSLDELMFPTVASLEVPYVLMHMKGVPLTMHQQPAYENVSQEVLDFLTIKLAILKKAGVRDIIIDPGFGFGKTIRHNFELLRRLGILEILGCPLMTGISRKSMVYKTLGLTADLALNGTTALHMAALINGSNILRVHDVKEAVEVVRLYEQYNHS